MCTICNVSLCIKEKIIAIRYIIEHDLEIDKYQNILRIKRIK